MNNKIRTLAVVLITCNCLFLPDSRAAFIELQPRLETGMMYYSIESMADNSITPSRYGETAGHYLAEKKHEFSDNVAFVSGGATFFINRLFVDLSGQYTFNGKARSHPSSSAYLEADNSFLSMDPEFRSRFYRTDMAVSAGCAVSENFSVYLGYKWSALDLDSSLDGPASYLKINEYVGNGRIEGQQYFRFRYEGPFIGIAQGRKFGKPGLFNGFISAKLALAYLRSKGTQEQIATFTIDSVNGVEIEPRGAPLHDIIEAKGSTLGLAVGFDWHGATSINNLSYGIGISGYRYNFNSDETDSQDINETAVTFKVGLSYLF